MQDIKTISSDALQSMIDDQVAALADHQMDLCGDCDAGRRCDVVRAHRPLLAQAEAEQRRRDRH